ncbi:MAG: alpha/beta fold hydrolase [Bacteroidales bacterium]|nr:alpha/beta fold hydrolase [Bacteroidales bacterium]
MLFIYWLLALIILGTAVLLILIMTKGFKNPVARHEIPENTPFKINEVFIPTVNNKKLYAWWIPVDTNAPTIIFIHGWGRNAQRLMTYLNQFCCQGFNLLAFDARSHGNSEKDGQANMLKFAEDILSVADYVNRETEIKSNDFYLVGLSIGGAASIYAAAHDQRIKKVVTVGAFARPDTVITKELKARHIPGPVIWLLYKIYKIFQNLDAEAIAPVHHIASAKAKFLLIHGEEDLVVPADEGKKLKEAAGTKAELWLIPGKGHSDCHLETGFWERLLIFFQTDETKK